MDADINMPLVSAIMTIYNGDKFAAAAIDSVLKQTYSNFELLILDDGSTDNTAQIILEKQRSDSRIQYIINEKNEGLSKTKNKIIPLTKGEYVAIVDADDINEPERFAKQVEAFRKHKDVQIVGTAMKLINGEDEVCDEWQYYANDADIKKGLTISTTIANPSAMFKPEVFYKLNGYDETLSICEDWDFFYRASKYFNFINLPEPLVYYRIHSSNTSVNKLEQTVLFAVYFKRNLPRSCFDLSLAEVAKAYPQYNADICENVTKFYSFSMHIFLKLKYEHLSFNLYRFVKNNFFAFYTRPAKKLFIKSAIAVYLRNGYYQRIPFLLKEYIFIK